MGEENRTQINEGRIYRIWYKGHPLPRRESWYQTKRDAPLADWSFEQLIDDLGPTSLPVWRVNAQNELVRRGATIRDELLAMLRAGKHSTMQQTWGIWVFGRSSLDDRVVDEYLSGLVSDLTAGQTGKLNLRLQALRILAQRLREAEHTKPLPDPVTAALRDPEARIRFEAVQAIWRSRDRTKLDALKELAAAEQDRLTFYAAWQALRGLATLPERKAMLDDQRPGVRFAALMGLMGDFELTKQEVLDRIESESDQRFIQWGLKWVLAGSPPRIVSNQKQRVGSSDNLQADDIVAQLESAANDRLRHVLLRMLSRFRVGGELSTRIRRIYDERIAGQSESGPDEIATWLDVLSGDPQSYPLLWDAMLSEQDIVRDAAMNGLTRGAGGREFLATHLGTSIESRQTIRAVQALARQQSGNESWPVDGPTIATLERLFIHTGDPRLKSDVLSVLARLDMMQLSDAERERILRLARSAGDDSDPRVHAIAPQIAARLGASVTLPERKAATIEDVLPLLAEASPGRGEEIFFDRQRANCSNCHQVGGRGTEFAPSLSDVGRADEATRDSGIDSSSQPQDYRRVCRHKRADCRGSSPFRCR